MIDVKSDIQKQIQRCQGAIRLLSPDVTSEDLKELGDFAVSAMVSEIQNRGSVVTGDLISKFEVIEDSPTSIRVVNTSEHVMPFEYGHGPIRPINAKVLHFVTKDGKEVFTKYVGPTDGAGVLDATMLSEVPKKAAEIIRRKEAELQKNV